MVSDCFCLMKRVPLSVAWITFLICSRCVASLAVVTAMPDIGRSMISPKWREALHTLLFCFDGKRNVDRGSVDGTVLQGCEPKQAFARVDDFDIPVRIEPQVSHGHAGQIVDPAGDRVDSQGFPLRVSTEADLGS